MRWSKLPVHGGGALSFEVPNRFAICMKLAKPWKVSSQWNRHQNRYTENEHYVYGSCTPDCVDVLYQYVHKPEKWMGASNSTYTSKVHKCTTYQPMMSWKLNVTHCIFTMQLEVQNMANTLFSWRTYKVRLTSAQFQTHVHTQCQFGVGTQEWNNGVGVCCWAVTITNDEKTVLSQAWLHT